MKYAILLCAFILIALVGAVCIFGTRSIDKIFLKKIKMDVNHKVEIIKIIGWLLLIVGLFLIYYINR